MLSIRTFLDRPELPLIATALQEQWRLTGIAVKVLIGNSGGASLSAFYQAQAEQLTITHMLDGDPAGLSPADLPPVDPAAYWRDAGELAGWPVLTGRVNTRSLR